MSETQLIFPAPVVHRVSHSPSQMRNTLRSPLKTFGGKFYLSKYILTVCAPAMTECDVWMEPCAGGANTSLQAEQRPGVAQIVSDSDPLIANVWRVFATSYLADELLGKLRDIDCKAQEGMEAEFNAATYYLGQVAMKDFENWSDMHRVTLALATIINSRMSRGGMGKDFAWQDRERGGQPGEINSWRTFVWQHAPRIAERCKNWMALNWDALKLLCPATSPDGGVSNPQHFVYLDPPYVKSTRTAKDVYRDDDFPHEDLLKLIYNAKARIAVSGYISPLYQEWLSKAHGWTLHAFALPNHSGQGKKKAERIECVWTNF